MRHKWEKVIDYKDSTFKEKHICKVCGCERYNSNSRYVGYLYSRSRISFDRIPECIDWEIENNKTID